MLLTERCSTADDCVLPRVKPDPLRGAFAVCSGVSCLHHPLWVAADRVPVRGECVRATWTYSIPIRPIQFLEFGKVGVFPRHDTQDALRKIVRSTRTAVVARTTTNRA